MSIFTAMAKDTRLKKNLKKSQTSVPQQQTKNSDFPGEDGDYPFIWTGFRDGDKDGVNYTVFEFSCQEEDPEEAYSFQMTIFIMFSDSKHMTVEDKQDQFFETLQLLGIETAGADIKDVEKAVAEMLTERPAYLCSVTTSGEYKNLNILEAIELEDDGEDGGEGESSEEVEAVNPNIDEDPADWVGYTCIYENMQYWIGSVPSEGHVSLTDSEDVVVYEEVPWALVVPESE